MFSKLALAFIAASAAIVNVHAETHTITFTNNCGYGTPYLRDQNGNVLSTGAPYTSNGPILGAIAYLQTGPCGNNGENCLLVETSLNGEFSSTDLSLIPPHSFQVTSGFGYYNGCDGAGADCTDPDCPDAMTDPSQTWKQVGCSVPNVDLAITFCD
ncbi:hypothetical protein WOLCODRAFT_76446 [Wolfiporia cocos MD-104 SS10]|uniref:Glycopeptide n=1 Tax=Wolfiporia cocos (strain MD-104) TaxID=742152 RepID=A0A2H3JSL8_WOLCO|nr:hypothetical protein WOLCODRAFT_76446 [Wolfiporia cocos MD-104 SS10]